MRSSRWQKTVAYFFSFIECGKLHETIYKGPQGIFTITVEVAKSFL